MKSEFGEVYNHDPWAADYDADVQNEANPIRAGYAAVLAWVVEQAQIMAESRVLDLGAGTGNLSAQIETCASLTCVDLSAKMTEKARPKLAHLPTQYVLADVLEYLATHDEIFDAIISTYAIHHLTEPEKMRFLGLVVEHLPAGGRAVFGDLMVQNEAAEEALKKHYRSEGPAWVADDMEEEFFWRVEPAVTRLEALGCGVEAKRFSALSWGISAVKK